MNKGRYINIRAYIKMLAKIAPYAGMMMGMAMDRVSTVVLFGVLAII